MENDNALPPNRVKPKGTNKPFRAKGENKPRQTAPAAQRPARSSGNSVAGIPTGVLLGGLAFAGMLAYLSTSDAGAAPASGSAVVAPANPAPQPTPAPSSGSSFPSVPDVFKPTVIVKKAHKAMYQPVSPLLYAFVNSIGGEGIFDRLRTVENVVDGWGLDRIVTLDNHEFAGFLTGRRWAAPTATATRGRYCELYMKIGNLIYNYWVDEAEITQMHSPTATAKMAAGELRMMSDAHSRAIQVWYATYYV